MRTIWKMINPRNQMVILNIWFFNVIILALWVLLPSSKPSPWPEHAKAAMNLLEWAALGTTNLVLVLVPWLGYWSKGRKIGEAIIAMDSEWNWTSYVVALIAAGIAMVDLFATEATMGQSFADFTMLGLVGQVIMFAFLMIFLTSLVSVAALDSENPSPEIVAVIAGLNSLVSFGLTLVIFSIYGGLYIMLVK